MRALPLLLLSAAQCRGAAHSSLLSGAVFARGGGPGASAGGCYGLEQIRCADTSCANCTTTHYECDVCLISPGVNVRFTSCSAAEGVTGDTYPPTNKNCSGPPQSTLNMKVDTCEPTGAPPIQSGEIKCTPPPPPTPDPPPPPPTPPPVPPGVPASVTLLRVKQPDGLFPSVIVPDVNAKTEFSPNYNSGRRGALAWDVCSLTSPVSPVQFSDGHPVWTQANGSQVDSFEVHGEGSVLVSYACLATYQYDNPNPLHGPYSYKDGRLYNKNLNPSYFEILHGGASQ